MPRLLVFLALGALLAQDSGGGRAALGLRSIRARDLRASVSYLASEQLHGRLSLDSGADAAARWVADQFRKAGLKPLAPDYMQAVPLLQYRMDRAASGITIHKDGKQVEAAYPEAYGSFPETKKAAGPVVFAGFGISAPELHYDDYAEIDARDKIVLIFDHEPQEYDPRSPFNGDGSTLHSGPYMKILTAQRHGARAVLIAGEPNRKHLSNQERLARVRSAGQRERIAVQALAESELKIPSYTISDALANRLLDGRAAELQRAIDDGLKPVSRDLPGTTVELRNVVAERRQAKTVNVAGYIEGSDPAFRQEIVVFGAHYDHDGTTQDGGYYPGADDDASGTAGIIALARAYARNPEKPKRSLAFVAFAAEERGLLGSYYYVQHPLRPLAATRAMINFDMIGRNETASEQTKGLVTIAADTSEELNLIGGYYSPDYRTAVEAANRAVGLKLNTKWDHEPALNIFFRSDHYPFVLNRVPALWWFTGFHPDYHQTGDTAEKLNYTKMEKIVKLAYLAGFEFGDTGSPPRFAVE